jgi:hypothetical protein
MKTNLQKTIFNLAMNGGSVIHKKTKKVYQVTSINLHTFLTWSDEYLPLLHSFNKLTEPVLDGGKVPIVELGKIAFGNRYNVVYAQIGDDGVFCTILAKNHRITKMVFSFETMSFYKVVDGTIKGFVPNQKQLFDQLNIWFFNTENLQPDEFIEITSLKEK